MRSADDLLRDILRTAHVTGLSREHQEAIGEALAAQVGVIRGTYKFEKMAAEVIGFDFDGTLNTRAGQQLWKNIGGDWVITARSLFNLDEVWKFNQSTARFQFHNI